MNSLNIPVKSKIYHYLFDIEANNVQEINHDGMDFIFTFTLDDFPMQISRSEDSLMIVSEMTIEINSEILKTGINSTQEKFETILENFSNNHDIIIDVRLEDCSKIIIKNKYFTEELEFFIRDFHRSIMNLKESTSLIYELLKNSLIQNEDKYKSNKDLSYFI